MNTFTCERCGRAFNSPLSSTTEDIPCPACGTRLATPTLDLRSNLVKRIGLTTLGVVFSGTVVYAATVSQHSFAIAGVCLVGAVLFILYPLRTRLRASQNATRIIDLEHDLAEALHANKNTAQLESEVNSLETQLATERTNAEHLKHRLAQEQNSRLAAVSTLEETKAQLKEGLGERLELDRVLRAEGDRRMSAETGARALEAQIDELKDQLVDLAGQLSSVQREKPELQKKLDSAEEKSRSAASANMALGESLSALRKQVEQLELRLSESSGTIRHENQARRTAEQRADRERSSRESVEQKLTEAQAELRRAREKLHETEGLLDEERKRKQILDFEKLEQKHKETIEVNQILEQAISDADFIAGDGMTRVPPAVEEKVDSRLATNNDGRFSTAHRNNDDLPDRYRRFLADLRSRERWLRRDADGLARRHGVMLGDSIEKINVWAQARYDACLVYDEGNEIILEVSVLAEVS